MTTKTCGTKKILSFQGHQLYTVADALMYIGDSDLITVGCDSGLIVGRSRGTMIFTTKAASLEELYHAILVIKSSKTLP